MWPCKYARVPIICFGQRLVFLVWAVSYCTVLKLQENPSLVSKAIQQKELGFHFTVCAILRWSDCLPRIRNQFPETSSLLWVCSPNK